MLDSDRAVAHPADPRMLPGFDLRQSIGVVTGAGSGIGRALACGLARHGAAVAVVDIDSGGAKTTASDMTRFGGSAVAVTADVRDPAQVQRVFEQTIERLGRPNVLVNNVGGSVGSDELSEHVTLDSWNRTLELTVTTAFLCSQQAARIMVADGGGRIINIASLYGLVGHDPRPYDRDRRGLPREQIAYAAAKGAVVSLTRGLAVYWGRSNIRVNAIAPGHVRTDRLSGKVSEGQWRRLARRTPIPRSAVPDDLVGAAVFLAAPASSFLTGHVLPVDGGWLAC